MRQIMVWTQYPTTETETKKVAGRTNKMKLPHAAAIAFWYLVMPPLSSHQSPDFHAPLSLWARVSEADSLEACELARMLRAQEALDRFDEADRLFDYAARDQRDPVPGLTAPYLYLDYRDARAYALAVALSRCVAAGDPVLKGK